MSAAMDRALMALSLEEEEEEVPFVMPELPGFSSTEENALSLIGRTLNPECQKISGLILTMPRKWQKEGRVRGVALSEEKFQFIFKNEHDLIDVLEKGVQTFNEWAIVLERWVENPPDDYLQFIPLWVQISKIPVNFYTEAALMTLGEMLGEVKVLAFDPTKPITQPFIRVQIRFNVANPLKMARVLDMGGGKTHTIHFDFEKLQKRCYTCKRLNHEKQVCPLEIKKRQSDATRRRERIIAEKFKDNSVLQQNDPLFGVLEEEQVDKVKKSVREVEKDPLLQRTILRLEQAPVFTTELNKGKGPVFDYGEKEMVRRNWDINAKPTKLLADSMKANRNVVLTDSSPRYNIGSNDEAEGYYLDTSSVSLTVFRAEFSKPSSSGTVRKRGPVRRRPPRAQRQRQMLALTAGNEVQVGERREGKQEVGARKRKKINQGTEEVPSIKAQCLSVIPREGSPPTQ
ncbi:uncharacterized protein LOC106364730 [Brassica napus]|uniref:uncharacterized protein LOC106364730 n=1 Tax=Brassica napus TaxID=3708 RepID=UPI00207A37F9|nr:uncharacterized protein LOC106364730 [Brassica napus]